MLEAHKEAVEPSEKEWLERNRRFADVIASLDERQKKTLVEILEWIDADSIISMLNN